MEKYFWSAIYYTEDSNLLIDALLYENFEGISDLFTKHEYHTTLMYSLDNRYYDINKASDINEEDEDFIDNPIAYDFGKLRVFGEDGSKVLVIELLGGEGEKFTNFIHNELKNEGFIPTYPEYRPHITVTDILDDEALKRVSEIDDNNRLINLKSFDLEVDKIVYVLQKVGD